MLLFAGCVGPFGEHAHLPKPLILAVCVGIRTTPRAKPLILVCGSLYYTRYAPGLLGVLTQPPHQARTTTPALNHQLEQTGVALRYAGAVMASSSGFMYIAFSNLSSHE